VIETHQTGPTLERSISFGIGSAIAECPFRVNLDTRGAAGHRSVAWCAPPSLVSSVPQAPRPSRHRLVVANYPPCLRHGTNALPGQGPHHKRFSPAGTSGECHARTTTGPDSTTAARTGAYALGVVAGPLPPWSQTPSASDCERDDSDDGRSEREGGHQGGHQHTRQAAIGPTVGVVVLADRGEVPGPPLQRR
jgi:hypothetical protein